MSTEWFADGKYNMQFLEFKKGITDYHDIKDAFFIIKDGELREISPEAREIIGKDRITIPDLIWFFKTSSYFSCKKA